MVRLFGVLALFLGASFAQNQSANQDKCPAFQEKIDNLVMIKLTTGAYHFNKIGMSWKNAEEFCKTHGMSLLMINSEEEMNLVAAAKPFPRGYYWVGSTDIGGEPGQFYWDDGRIVDRAWRFDRYNYRRGKETCLDLCDKLEDDPCSKKFDSVCEVAPELVHCV